MACSRKGTKGFMWMVNFENSYDLEDWDFMWSLMNEGSISF